MADKKNHFYILYFTKVTARGVDFPPKIRWPGHLKKYGKFHSPTKVTGKFFRPILLIRFQTQSPAAGSSISVLTMVQKISKDDLCAGPELKPRYHMTSLQTLIDIDMMASLDKQNELKRQKNKKTCL